MNDLPQSPAPSVELRAIKWFTLAHVFGLLVFVAILGGFFWYLNEAGREQKRQELYRDVDAAQQLIRLSLRENQDEFVEAATALSPLAPPSERDLEQIRDFLRRNDYAVYVAAIGPDRRVRWILHGKGVPAIAPRLEREAIADAVGVRAFDRAREERRPAYTDAFAGFDGETLFEMHAPMLRDAGVAGTIVVGYSLDRLLATAMQPDVRSRYRLAIADSSGKLIVGQPFAPGGLTSLSYAPLLEPPGHGMRLRAEAVDLTPRLVERNLLLAVFALSAASLVSLVLLWRHARRRFIAEAERDRLFRLSQDLMCVLDATGRILRMNPAFEAMAGAQSATPNLFDLVHPADRAKLASALDPQHQAPDTRASVELRLSESAQPDWRSRWLQWSMRRDPDPRSTTWYAIAHDVTERKAAEAALRAETAFRKAMEESILTGMRAFDLEGRITYVNRAFCEMLGYPREELIGARPPYPYWPKEQVELSHANMQMILEGRAPQAGFEVRVQRRDGSTFDARMYVSPLIDDEGVQSGWMTSVTDITEPRRVREELAAAHERFTKVLDELNAAVLVLELELDNSRAADATPLFTNSLCRSQFRAPEDLAAVVAASATPLADGEARELLLPASGRWFDLRPRLIRWVDGQQVRLVVATDVTRRHEAEERQREQDERLQHSARLVTMGEMASSLAHELNQPLTAIRNYCMGLATRVRARHARGVSIDPEETLDALTKAAAQAERAGTVIQRIRAFVKRSEPERQRCQVAAIVAEAIGLAEIDARRRGVRIEVEIDPVIEAVFADPILIEQVLLNLAKNAIDAMRGSRRRTLRIVATNRDGQVEFAVIDTGPGLSAEARSRLFEPFFTTKPEGMGMGLNICRSVVEAHRGRLWIERDDAGGCAFMFTLPTAEAASMTKAA